MKQWSDFNEYGDLPPGIHQATLTEVIEHFGQGTPQRHIMTRHLREISVAPGSLSGRMFPQYTRFVLCSLRTSRC